MKLALTSILALAALSFTAFAQSTTPLDIKSIDPAELKSYLGVWSVQDESGKKKCKVTLATDEVIGGMKIDVAKGCAKTFPVMGDVAAWRLYEGWEIAFADATRHEVLRFYTPDNDYISYKKVDGIFTIVKK
jgi:hypothetical protein